MPRMYKSNTPNPSPTRQHFVSFFTAHSPSSWTPPPVRHLLCSEMVVDLAPSPRDSAQVAGRPHPLLLGPQAVARGAMLMKMVDMTPFPHMVHPLSTATREVRLETVTYLVLLPCLHLVLSRYVNLPPCGEKLLQGTRGVTPYSEQLLSNANLSSYNYYYK